MTNSTDSLWTFNASDLINLLRKKDIGPEEVLVSSLNRIKEVNQDINAVITLCADRAKKIITENPKKINSVLALLPVLIKDTTEVAGVKTTYGSKLYENYISKDSDILVSNIEENGGLVLGKTNTPEFAAGSNTFNDVFGTTKNPWNLKLSAGGSSGGSGAALASGMAWFATGSDLGGSLRNPASWNGVVGLRPTPGLISHGPSNNPFNTLSVSGPMARNITDLSIFLDAMAVYNHLDPLSKKRDISSFYANLSKDSSFTYNIGITEDFGLFPCDNEIKAMMGNTFKLIKSLGHNLENTYPSMEDAEESFQILRAFLFFSAYGFLLPDQKNVKKEIIWNIEKGKNLTVNEIIKAENIRVKLYKNISKFFNDHDFLICPSSSVVPFTHQTRWVKQIENKTFDNYVSWLMICGCISLINCPSLSIPTSIAKNGAPIGIQIIAPPFKELKLLNFAKKIENEINISEMLPINFKNDLPQR